MSPEHAPAKSVNKRAIDAKVRDQHAKRPFVQVPSWLVWSDVSSSAMQVYMSALLAGHWNTRTYSMGPAYLATLMGVSPDTVKRGFRELRRVGAATVAGATLPGSAPAWTLAHPEEPPPLGLVVSSGGIARPPRIEKWTSEDLARHLEYLVEAADHLRGLSVQAFSDRTRGVDELSQAMSKGLSAAVIKAGFDLVAVRLQGQLRPQEAVWSFVRRNWAWIYPWITEAHEKGWYDLTAGDWKSALDVKVPDLPPPDTESVWPRSRDADPDAWWHAVRQPHDPRPHAMSVSGWTGQDFGDHIMALAGMSASEVWSDVVLCRVVQETGRSSAPLEARVALLGAVDTWSAARRSPRSETHEPAMWDSLMLERLHTGFDGAAARRLGRVRYRHDPRLVPGFPT